MKSCKSIREIVESNLIDVENWYLINTKDEELRYILRERPTINRSKFIEDVCKAFEEDRVIVLNSEWHRGIGKSSIVKEMTEHYKIPVIVGSEVQKRLLKSSGVKEVFTVGELDNLRGFTSKNVLVDFFTNSDEIVNELRFRGNNPVGFVQRFRKSYEIG